jgi:HAD superfamily hydrolase (TIGR01509 family)
MKLALIIFDCDGVLVDTQAVINTIEWDYLLQHGMQMTLEEFTKRFSGVKASTIIEILRKENNVRLLKNVQEIIKEIDSLILAKLSGEKIPPIKGVKEALQNIPFKKCVASNASLRVLRPLLLASSLAAYFDNHIFSADIVERPKPYPDLFLCAARSMQVEPKQCLVIEDSEAGVKAAVAAGMKVWGFLGGKHINSETASKLLGSGAERTFQNMDELVELLEAYQ